MSSVIRIMDVLPETEGAEIYGYYLEDDLPDYLNGCRFFGQK